MHIDFFSQNLLLVGLVLGSGLALVWPMLARPSGRGVSPGEATLLINREHARIVDVREPDEFAAGHLPDAVNIPVGKLDERIGELESLKEKPLVICCASGMRAGKACTALQKRGFTNLYNLSGGVDAWSGAGYPLMKKAGKKK